MYENDAYRDSRNYSIKANATLDIDATGTAVKHLRGDDNLDISFDNKPQTDFAVGMGYPHGSIAPFSKITLINETANPVTGVISYGSGNVDNDSLVIANALQVKNENGGTLDTSDGDAHTKLDTAIDKLNSILIQVGNIYPATLLLRGREHNGDYLSKGVTDLSGATKYSATATTTTVISAAANTDGFIIRWANWTSNNNGEFGPLVDGSQLYPRSLDANVPGGGVLNDILVPAGVKVEAYSNYGAGTCVLWGEAL